MYTVILSKKVKRDLRKLPLHVVRKLTAWVEAVSYEGLHEVRKTPGFHDEPLKGVREGQRSIRLSRAYRAIYEIDEHNDIVKIEIVEVNKHEY
ncbi:MAG: type II toxin-antitoxin system mRNA interferase toxin, RelE/StbE family [Gammaproteobacteria bacterium]|nr:type II toxin-antitoxin system mRNA interferase toxin, RelE/StbE family [Gammaproteobacteria bacterium]